MRNNANAEAALWALSQRTGRGVDKLLLAVLTRYENNDKEAWPSQSTLAAECEIDIKTIILGLKRLELSGFISKMGNGQNGTVKYRINRGGGPENGGPPPPETGDECTGTSKSVLTEGVQGETQTELLPAPPPPPAKPKPIKNRGTLEEVRAYCASLGLPQSDADWFFNKCEGNGWKNGGEPIQVWRSTISAWKLAGYMPSQRSGQTRQATPAARREAEVSRTMQVPLTARTVVTYGANEHNGHKTQ